MSAQGGLSTVEREAWDALLAAIDRAGRRPGAVADAAVSRAGRRAYRTRMPPGTDEERRAFFTVAKLAKAFDATPQDKRDEALADLALTAAQCEAFLDAPPAPSPARFDRSLPTGDRD